MIKNCEKCGTPFTYKEVRRSIVFISKDNKLICKNCGRCYTTTIKSRIIYSMFQNLPLLSFVFTPSSQWILVALLYIPYIVALAFISPYFTRWRQIGEEADIMSNHN